MKPTNGQHNRSGWRILIVGTGGQGVLTAARLLGESLVEQGRYVVSGQLHGMAQRGGSVQSSVVIDGGLSPVIARGRADFVVGFEPVETVRALPFMSAHTVVHMNTAPVIPYVLGQRSVMKQDRAEYPPVKQLTEAVRALTAQVFPFDATRMARESGSAKTLNVLMLGCLLGCGSLPCTAEDFWNSAVKKIPSALTETNTRAFFKGLELVEEFRPSKGK